jgi:hypothetical protein
MKADFSRSTFDPKKHYTGVRMQQGRVQLDADWNEQADIVTYRTETSLKDLIGASGAPAEQPGFQIRLPESGPGSSSGHSEHTEGGEARLPYFTIGAGHYYVDGILCENEQDVLFAEQPDYPGDAAQPSFQLDRRYLVYLDVWRRHITALEDPSIREVALGGPDTTTRVEIVWQVRLLPISDSDADASPLKVEWENYMPQRTTRGQLSAKINEPNNALENRLYRVEVHDEGLANDKATFKWSRENGSVIFPIRDDQEPGLGKVVVDLGPDPNQLHVGDWVEIVSDDHVLAGKPGSLHRVKRIDDQTITLEDEFQLPAERKSQHMLLRRWDHDPHEATPERGDIPIQSGDYIGLENGIQVQFSPEGTYHTGEYWLIPARTLTGDIEWPRDASDNPLAQLPHIIDHHYAPLAIVNHTLQGWMVDDLRTIFVPLNRLPDYCITATEAEQERLRQDLAILEGLFPKYWTHENLGPGDVVALNRGNSDWIIKADAGDPKLVLGVVVDVFPHHETPFECRVALYGCVSCKVTGKIEPGDVLVPSKVPGHAQRAGLYIQPGTVIGKALDYFDPSAPTTENSLVRVLVTLA